MGLGDKFETHNDYFAGLDGYNQNDKLNSENFMPTSSADKSFFLRWPTKTQQKQTGNSEVTGITWILKVLFKKGQGTPYPDFLKATWNSIDTLEKGYLNFGAGDNDGDRVFIENIELEDINQNYTSATLTGRLMFRRDLSV